MGKISRPVYTDGIIKQTVFTVVDCHSSYNALLGRPSIHAMRAVSSTFHQMIKFLAWIQVGQICGEPRGIPPSPINHIRGGSRDGSEGVRYGTRT